MTSRSPNVLKISQHLSPYRVESRRGISLPKGPNQLDERVPIEVGTIQVNFCTNPQCQNFGIPKEIIADKETNQQFGELGPPLVCLRPLQTGYGWQTAGHLPRLLQFRGSWQEQADSGNAAGTGKGQDHY